METVRRHMEECKEVSRKLEKAEDPQVWANIIDIQKAANDNAVKIAGLELSVDSIKESETLAEAFEKESDYYNWMTEGVQRKTGVNISDVAFAALPDSVAGRYHIKSKQIELDHNLRGHRNKILHVAIHEALHACIGSKNPELRLDIDFEEGIVEMLAAELTAELTGTNENIIAYHQQVNAVKRGIGSEKGVIKRATLNGDVETLLDYQQKLAA